MFLVVITSLEEFWRLLHFCTTTVGYVDINLNSGLVGEATRVQWTPPLRESFAYPTLVAEILILTHLLKYL